MNKRQCYHPETDNYKYWTEEETEKLIKYFNEGKPIKEIIILLNKTKGAIGRKIDRLRRDNIISFRRKKLNYQILGKIEALINEGINIHRIARELSIPYTSLRNFCNKNGISTDRCIATILWTKNEIDQLQELLNNQLTFKIIGQILNKTTLQVTRKVQCLGLKSYRPKYNKKYLDYKEINGGYFNTIKVGAELRNIKFNITIQDAYEQWIKQNKKCALSGIELVMFSKYGKDNIYSASLDRIDSSKEYTKDNIQWVHKDINMIKKDYPESEFLYWIEKIYLHKFNT